jgi:hypothetical protein
MQQGAGRSERRIIADLYFFCARRVDKQIMRIFILLPQKKIPENLDLAGISLRYQKQAAYKAICFSAINFLKLISP